MKGKTPKVTKLYICHDCHERIKENEVFTRYLDMILCETCYQEQMNTFNLGDYLYHEIMIADENIQEHSASGLINDEFSGLEQIAKPYIVK